MFWPNNTLATDRKNTAVEEPRNLRNKMAMEKEKEIELIQDTISQFEHIRQYRKVKYLDADFHVVDARMKNLLGEVFSSKCKKTREKNDIRNKQEYERKATPNHRIHADTQSQAVFYFCAVCVKTRSCQVIIGFWRR